MKIKSYSNIWKTEKVFYAFNDLTLPRPITATQMVWGVVFFFLSLVMNGIPPFIFRDSMLMNHIAIPVAMAWFMSRRSFDGKRPQSFLRSYFLYLVQPKIRTRGKYVDIYDMQYQDICITVGAGRNREEVRKGR